MSFRRACDGTVLPAVFGADHIDRRVAPGVDYQQAREPELVTECQSDSSIVIRLPAGLDIATAEAIHEAVIPAVDHASGEVVLDLDGVRFLDSTTPSR